MYVKINEKLIDDCLHLINKPQTSSSLILKYLKLNELSNEQIARFLLVLQSIDFCFWSSPKWEITYKDQNFSGFYGLVISLIRALEENYDILDFDYLKTISSRDLEHILRGTNKIALFDERLKILHSIAQISLEKLDGMLYKYFLKAKSDLELLNLIVDIFPAFKDISNYENKEVLFLKKATLLVYDLYTFLPEIKNNIVNTDNLKAGADYKLPQVLRELNILEYSDDLAQKIDNNICLEHGSKMEIEIRLRTIETIDIIQRKLINQGKSITSLEIGTAIWLLSKTGNYQKNPYHLCENIFY